MSEQTSQEPTMEEILASIRRIISEDDTPPDGADAVAPVADEAAAQPEPEPEPVAAAPEPALEPEPEPEPVADQPEPVALAEPDPTPEPAEEEEDLELTDKVETLGDLDVFSAPSPTLEEAPAPVAAASVERLVSEPVASAAASAFGALSAAITMPRGERTLEDVVREMLRPMLHDWLDSNLPGIVQQVVEAEVERIARSRR